MRLEELKLKNISYVGIILCLIGLIVSYQITNEIYISRFAGPISALISSFAAAFAVSAIYEIFIKRAAADDLRATVRSEMEETLSVMMRVRARGIRAVHEKFDDKLIFQRGREAKEIFVLQTYAPNFPQIEPALGRCLAQGMKIRVALLDPESPFVPVRAADLGQSAEDFKAQIRNNLRDLAKHANKSGNKTDLEVRLYKGTPGVSIHGSDKGMLVGTFLAIHAINSPQIEISAKSMLYKIYAAHFEQIWQDAKEWKLN